MKTTRLPLIVAIMLLSACLFAQTPRHALVINSYHKGYQWTDEQSESVLRSLLALPDVTVDVVYMDWKRFPFQSTIDDLRATLAHRYREKRVDLIVTGDDAALDFAVKNRRELFNSAPIVFMAIFGSADQRLTRGESGITGVYETIDLEGTIRDALHIFPNSKRIYIIHDGSETSLTMEADINAYLDGVGSTLERVVLGGLVFRDLLDELSRVEKGSIVLLASYARDPENLTLPPEVFAKDMSDHCPVPLFILYTHMIGTGAFGGSLLDGNLQGKTAGELARKVLSGTPIDGIPRVPEKTVYSCYDYAVMERFGIDARALPAGSAIINKPFSFIAAYRNLVIGTSIAFVIMVTLIAVLFLNIARRKFAQEALKETHAQLMDSAANLERKIAALNESEARLRKSESVYRLISEAAEDIIWQWDLSDKRSLSPRFHELLGYPEDTISSMNAWIALVHPEDRAAIESRLAEHLAGLSPAYRGEFRIRKSSGDYMWFKVSGKAVFDEDGNPLWMAGSYTDITEAKRRQERLDRLAFFDSLTGLPNRVLLRERVDQAIDAISRKGGSLWMMFIDMDNFKYINDSFGHVDGDALLVEAASRLQSRLPESGFVSRLGGDEFIILVAGDYGLGEINALAASLHESFVAPFQIGKNVFYMTFSMGIVSWPNDGATYDVLLKNADTALYSSKAAGKSRFVHFDGDMNRSVVERTTLQTRLHQALENGEFFLQFQPQVQTETLAIRGVEALVRWQSPELGLVPPGKFIGTCEESGQIVPLGNWILETACRKMRSLVERGFSNLIMSVNISVVQLAQGSFVDLVKGILSSSGISPRNLELEITESILIESFESNTHKLRALNEYGVRIALDDFGSGYSSLNYLRKLPITTLKIDKSFIDTVEQDFESRSLVNSIIDIARVMELEVVAEGIENDTQRAILAESACHWIQGYLVSKPLDSPALDRFIDGWKDRS